MQVQCLDAMLQGLGYCLGTVGPSLCTMVQEELHGGSVG